MHIYFIHSSNSVYIDVSGIPAEIADLVALEVLNLFNNQIEVQHLLSLITSHSCT